MYVDPRVAHARAKIQLSERAIDPVSVVAPVCRTIQRGLQDILDRGMSGRAMHRHLHGPVVSALSRLGVHAWIDEDDSDVYLRAAKVICDATHGLQGLMFTCGIKADRGTVRVQTWFTITPHAIARCLQRNGAMKLVEIIGELNIATGIADRMLVLSLDAGWRQALVPTPQGVFVGEIDRDQGLVMRTYLRPRDCGWGSRWLRLLDALPPLTPDGAVFDMDEFRKRLSRWLDENTTTLAARFPFMQRPWEPADDPSDAVWSAAREAAGHEPTGPEAA